MDKVLPKLKREACRAGGDAIIFKSSQTHVGDSIGEEELTVTAVVIRWTD
jgi:hypothetical protein